MGKTSVQLINTGCFYADGGCMFGATPQSAWKRRYKADEQNRCLLAMHSGLITTESGRIILVDNGVGCKHIEKLKTSSYRFHALVDLCEELQQRGIHPEEVTDIVLTHLHFDHCGGTTRYDEDGRVVPVFPHATCWVGEAQWNESVQPNPLEKDSFFSENIEIVEKLGKLNLVNDEMFICPEVRLRLFNGHTRGQIVADVQTDHRAIVFAGDVIPTAAHVSPTWISAYDIYPLATYHEKIRLLDEAVTDDKVIVYCHDAYISCSTVKKINDFYKIDSKIAI